MNTKTKIASIIVGIVVIIFIIVALTNKSAPSEGLDVNIASSTDATGSSTSTTSGSVSTSTKPTTSSTATTGTVSAKADDSKVTTAGLEEAVFANNEFALNMYIQLANAEKGKNIFFSPYSITTALGMIYEGARGTTSDEMANVLLITDANARRSATARIYNEMNAVNSAYTLKTANALWAEKSYPLLSSYLKTVNIYYKGGVSSLDFRSNTDKSRVTINAWVEKQTNGKIPELIPHGALSSDTRLVLTNAIYFKGKWVTQFKTADTKKISFKIDATSTALADMMTITGKEFIYASSTAGQILELPYAGGRLSMIIALDRGVPMTTNDVSKLKDAMKKQPVNIFIPRFKMQTAYTLNDALSALGMPTAFSANADFSGISASNDLQVSEVLHKTFIEVNEEGTEAAAATGGMMTATSMPVAVPEFKADHPFLFMIRDMKTDEIIFMGKVANPNL
jgi:serpin B